MEKNHLLREQEAAKILGISIRCLQAWRFQGRGPKYVKLGAAVRYRPTDLDQFIAQNTVAATGAAAGR